MKRHRPEDTGWDKVKGWVLRYRGLASWAWGAGLGGVAGVIGMRFVVLAQLNAQNVSHTARMDTLAVDRKSDHARLVLIEGAVVTLANDVCSRYTQSQQETRQMRCNPHVYKGAP